jgi:predicted ATPase/DNA-binding CsgD family transcriptional regulator
MGRARVGSPLGLSAREADVVRLVAEGLTNRQIASKLFVTEDTVKKHLTHAMTRTGYTNRTSLALAWRQATSGVSSSGEQGCVNTCPPPADVPVRLTRFIGRQQELAEIKETLQVSRLVTVAGSGGCGKTRLALQLAHELMGRGEAVWWVDLSNVAVGESVLAATAHALDVPQGSAVDLAEALVQRLRPWKGVLIVDNCEHVLGSCVPMIELLLAGCPQLRVLATSREALRAEGEKVWRLPSLSTPSPQVVSAEALATFEAVQLFCDRAQAATPRFRLADDNAAAIGLICRRLDGISLAVELAASAVATYTPQRIAETLQDFLLALTENGCATIPRHRTLRACIEWSHALLSEEERVLFRRLSVFAASFSVESAVVVAGAPPLSPAAVIATLPQLVSKSVLTVTPSGSDNRYRYLDSVRAYAGEQLANVGESDTIITRFIQATRARIERLTRNLGTTNQPESMELLSVEYPNLHAAVSAAVRQGDDEAALSILGVLGEYFFVTHDVRLRERWVAEVLAATNPAPSLCRARALASAGYLALRTSPRLSTADEYGAAAAEIARALGDTQTITNALIVRGVAGSRFNPVGARACINTAIELARQEGSDFHLAHGLLLLALSWRRQSVLDAAREALSQAAPVVRRLGTVDAQAWHATVSALVAVRSGQLVAARWWAGRGAHFAALMGDPISRAFAAIAEAEAAGWQHHTDQARQVIDGLMAAGERQGWQARPIALLRCAAGQLALAAADLETAEYEFHQAVDEPALDALEHAVCQAGLAELSIRRHHMASMTSFVQSIQATAGRLDNRWLESLADRIAAQAARAQGAADEAAARAHRALVQQLANGYQLDAIATLELLAGIALDGGSASEAALMFGAAHAERTRLDIHHRPIDQHAYEAERQRLREAPNRARVKASWAEGSRLSLQQFAHSVLGLITPPMDEPQTVA